MRDAGSRLPFRGAGGVSDREYTYLAGFCRRCLADHRFVRGLADGGFVVTGPDVRSSRNFGHVDGVRANVLLRGAARSLNDGCAVRSAADSIMGMGW